MKTTKGSEGKGICTFNRQTCNEKASLQPDSPTLRRQRASVQLGAKRGLTQLMAHTNGDGSHLCEAEQGSENALALDADH